MEPYKYLIIFLVISVVFSCIYVLYTIPEQIKKGAFRIPMTILIILGSMRRLGVTYLYAFGLRS